MKIKISFLFLFFFPYYNAISQTNEIQLRYNIGNQYEELFGVSSNWFDIDEQGLSSKIISHPFRYHSINNLKSGNRYYNEEDFFRYFYLGLAFKKDSILGKYFFRFRVDKFYFNGKAKTTDNGYLVSGYYLWREIYYKTEISSMQFTPCFGRSFKSKFLTIDIGVEIPLYIRGEQEDY